MNNNEAIYAMRQRGASYQQISEKLGLSKNTVASYCRRKHIFVLDVAERRCDHCGQLLIESAQSHSKRFCSDACRMAWWKGHPEALERKAFYPATCLLCGHTFQAYGNAKRKYCSRKCYVKARSLPK